VVHKIGILTVARYFRVLVAILLTATWIKSTRWYRIYKVPQDSHCWNCKRHQKRWKF